MVYFEKAHAAWYTSQPAAQQKQAEKESGKEIKARP
jgi:hypothetical protein